jgi:8-oxo-dGTP diphosphatase
MVSSGPRVGVGAVVVHDGALLLVQRANAPGKGLWSLPGGHVEHGELLADAVRREVLEETGLDVEVGDLAGIFEVPGDPHYVILDFLATVKERGAPLAAGDVGDARWVPLDDVAALDCTPRFVETLTAWGILASRNEGD